MANSLTMLATIMARAGGRAVNLFVFLVLARMLSLEELGLFGFAYTTTLILASTFDVGVRNSVAFFIGRQPEDAATFALQSLKLWTMLVIPCVTALGVTLLVAAPALTSPIRLSACVILVASLHFVRMMQGVLIGQGRLARYNASELANRVSLLVTTLALVALGRLSIDTALWSLAISALVTAIVVGSQLGASTSTGRWKDSEIPRTLLGRGVQFMMAVLLMNLCKRLAFLVVSQVGTDADSGAFYGVLRLTEVLTEIGLAVAVVVFSSNVRSRNDAEAVAMAAHSTRLSFAVFSVTTIVGIVGAAWLLPLAMGSEFSAVIGLFRIVLVGTLVGTIWIILFPSLSAIAEPLVAIRIFLPNAVLGGVLSVILHRIGGLHGVAWAYLAANMVLSTTFLLVFRSRYGAALSDFLIVRRSDIEEAVLGLVNRLPRRLGLRWNTRSELP